MATIEKLMEMAREEGLFLEETHFPELGLSGTKTFHKGKVRDSYWPNDADFGVMVTTDRISAFDKVLRNPMPAKGYLLNEQSGKMFSYLRDVGPNHLREEIHPNTVVVNKAETIPVEVIVRGYLTGSGWRDHKNRAFAENYGFEITPKMVEGGVLWKDCKLKEPILTPTTKGEEKDEPLTDEQAEKEVGDPHTWQKMKEKALEAYSKAHDYLEGQGIITPDTKIEFGTFDRELCFIDETFTSDSSRFWDASQYKERFEKGEDQVMLDKEVVRQFLLKNKLNKLPGVVLPHQIEDQTIEGYVNVMAKIRNIDPVEATAELQHYLERIKEECGVEKSIYNSLLEHGLVKGYFVSIIAGSGGDTDMNLVNRTTKPLEEMKIPYGISVVSAHKDPRRFLDLVDWIQQYPGDVLFLDFTGMSNGKGPLTAGFSSRQVVHCYDNKGDKDSTDLHSSINVPKGVPLVTANGPINSALAAAQILSYGHKELEGPISEYRQKFIQTGVDHHEKHGRVYRPG